MNHNRTTKAASSDERIGRSTTPDKHMSSISKMEPSLVPVSPITEETAIRELEQARREVEELIKDDSADETVRQTAVRKLKQAELQYQNIVFSQAQVHVREGHHPETTKMDSSCKAGTGDKNVTKEHDVDESKHNPIVVEQHHNEGDESVVEGAVRKAERSLSPETGQARSSNNSERSTNESDDEETSSGFEDSSLLEPFETNGQKVTIEVIPISDDIDLEALGQAISEIDSEEKWLKSRKIIKAAVGSKLVLRLNRAVTVKEVDGICDRLTDELPDDIQSLEVKFHPSLL